MLAKPSKVAGGCRVTKTIAGRPALLSVVEPAGGTTWTKRTQGSDHQAAGEFAPPLCRPCGARALFWDGPGAACSLRFALAPGYPLPRLRR
jgi:hypothetical protein